MIDNMYKCSRCNQKYFDDHCEKTAWCECYKDVVVLQKVTRDELLIQAQGLADKYNFRSFNRLIKLLDLGTLIITKRVDAAQVRMLRHMLNK